MRRVSGQVDHRDAFDRRFLFWKPVTSSIEFDVGQATLPRYDKNKRQTKGNRTLELSMLKHHQLVTVQRLSRMTMFRDRMHGTGDLPQVIIVKFDIARLAKV